MRKVLKEILAASIIMVPMIAVVVWRLLTWR